ncbi:hypothetical protein [Leucobacter sp. G161]|uniref:hypothetical protein n=1 Tax=Leucobacter sp. G161 TaxID=663704 RepID=UPI00073B1D40|nr:hypothetical protein [Leucobacter sp. G161]KUF06595.1 hypothetical protein AUL38_12145 [Leucobacter sp. G161]
MPRTSVPRRDRTFSIAVATLLAASAVLSGGSAAQATPGLNVGTHTVSANVYVHASDTPIGLNAYVTNPAAPPLGYPSSPVVGNATLEVQPDGTELLTVPLVNTTFGVLSFPAASADGAVSVVETGTTAWKTASGGPKTRISTVTFDVTDFAGGAAVATFSPSQEYANFFLYRGVKQWDLNLVWDTTTAR